MYYYLETVNKLKNKKLMELEVTNEQLVKKIWEINRNLLDKDSKFNFDGMIGFAEKYQKYLKVTITYNGIHRHLKI